MHRTANTFADRFAPKFGLPATCPALGESFDANNDLHLGRDGVIRPRHEWQGRAIDTARYKSVVAACADALIAYNRATMSPADFANHYGDDPTECGFGG